MIVKLLAEHHLDFLSLKGGCRGSFESTLSKMSICWKSHAAAHLTVLHNTSMAIGNLHNSPKTAAFVVFLWTPK